MPRAATAKAKAKAATKPVKKTATAKKQSNSDAVAKRAYELFIARGGQHGYHIEDWLTAEKEILG